MAAQVTNTFVIEFDGHGLPPDVDVASIVVEDQLHLPDSFTVTFRDGARSALDKSGAKVGAAVRVAVLNDSAQKPATIFKGEVTALEAEIHHGTSYSIVRGYDQSHRLMHGSVTESYRNATYADIAKKVAERHHLKAGHIEGSSPTHVHVVQANESDWEFLRRLAAEVGYELTVVDGQLDFHPPVSSSAAPPPGDLTTEDPHRLLVGSNLLELRAVVTAAEQVEEAEARGWDAATKKAIVSTVAVKTETVANGQDPARLASLFPGPRLVTTDVPHATSKDVDNAARALAEQVAAAFTDIEGQARGDPSLRAGTPVTIGLLGAPFDGKYVLTGSRHRYDAEEGYTTSFTISGRQERSLLGLVAGDGPSGRISGVVPGVVDDVDDPDQQGRVRLRFPWMADQYVSDWSRVAHAGAGADRGFFILPEVGDEVVVSFDQGDVRRPFVLGGLYNGQDKAKTGPAPFLDGSSHAVNNRLFTSRAGHQLVFIDASDHCGVVVSTGDGGIEVRLDQARSTVEVRSSGDVTVTADGATKIRTKGAFEVSAQSIKLEAQGDASLEGAQVSIQGSGPVKVAGQPIQLN
ncbi:MAG TPA: VgrG-related protein [Acidimicrobiales bacterium]|jgi:uncharacterized protein involved in type VI secretion and phage assembly